MGEVQARVWAVQFPAYLRMIEEAETAEAVEAIVIDYNNFEVQEESEEE